MRLETLILQWNEEKTEIVQILRSQLEITTNEDVSVTLVSHLQEKYVKIWKKSSGWISYLYASQSAPTLDQTNNPFEYLPWDLE